MTIYTNRAVVGPDGRFVDSGSQIPDSWATDFKDWVDGAIKQGSFVDEEPPVADPPPPPAMADAEVRVDAGRKVEAKR